METAVRNELTLEKEEIKRILPHRGRMLLLDRVVITAEEIRGELTVTKDMCEGHAVLDGELVLRGSDLLDMASQLLGVFLAIDFEVLGRKCMPREYGRAEFRARIKPLEKIIIEMPLPIEEEAVRSSVFFTGRHFTVLDEKRRTRAKIESVELVVI